jgi:hypothetical protein
VDAGDGVAKLVEVHWFWQKMRGAEAFGFPMGAGQTGDDDHRDPRERPVAELSGSKLRAIHDRQLKVEEDDAGLRPGSQIVEGIPAIPAHQDVIALGPQRHAHDFAHRLVVVDDEKGADVRWANGIHDDV